MPDAKTVDAFVALVERGAYVEAMERFYAADASMQENTGEPRRGIEALIAGEKGFLGRFDSVKAERLSPPMIADEHVTIVWRWTMTKDGKASSFEEVAWQVWASGKIRTERFFYDPSTMG